LEEGLAHAEQNGITEVCVWTDGDWSKVPVNFDFLKDRGFIKTFHWLIPMSKKSNIDGLKNLANLKNLRWSGASDFNFDFSMLPNLEELHLGYGPKIKGWHTLINLRKLMIGGVKTDDLSFLKHAVNLEYLRIVGGKFESIAGIDNCEKLKTLFIQKCTELTELQPTINQLKNLEQLNLEGCKKINAQQLSGLSIKHLSII